MAGTGPQLDRGATVSDLELKLLILAAWVEARVAWHHVQRSTYKRLRCSDPQEQLAEAAKRLLHSTEPFAFGPLSWPFIGFSRRSLLMRIENQLVHILHQQGITAADGNIIWLRTHSSKGSMSWYITSTP